jgi:perosamine synthetase
MSRTIPWWMPQIGDAEYELVKRVLDSNYLNEGQITERFESEIASLLGVRHVVAVTSGTVAIYLALAGLGVGAGDEVIVPDMTFIATANAVTMTGARPVLVDVDPRSLNMDPAAVARAINERTRAIVPVHVSGRAADMQSILEIAEQHRLMVVEDAAEGFVSKLDGRYLGTFGRAGCLSFSPNKTITTGQGGAILTDDSNLYGRLRELKDQGRPVRGTGGDDIHYSVGYNFKFTNLQAAVGLGQLGYLEGRLQRMREIYRIYVARLSDLPGISLPGFDIGAGETPQWTDAIVEQRDELDRFLASRKIHCRRFWHPLHTQAPYRQSDEYFPNSSRVAPHALWLPSAFTLTDEDVAAVCEQICSFIRNETSLVTGSFRTEGL